MMRFDEKDSKWGDLAEGSQSLDDSQRSEIILPYVHTKINLQDLNFANFKLISAEEIKKLKMEFTLDGRYGKNETGANYTLIVKEGQHFVVYYGDKNKIGKGSFAIAKLVEHLDTGELHALKVQFDRLDLIENELASLIQAKRAVMVNDKPVAFKRFSPSKNKEQFYTLIKLAKGNDLFSYAIEDTEIKWPAIIWMEIAEKFLECIIELHDAGILHRDLKLENTHYFPSGEELDIVDFGFAVLMNLVGEYKAKKICGSPDYLAPEIFGTHTYTKKTEAYAGGVILSAIFSLAYFENKILRVYDENSLWFINNKRITTVNVKNALRMLVINLLEVDKDLRLSLESALVEIRQQQFFLNTVDKTIKTLVIDVNDFPLFKDAQNFMLLLKNYYEVRLIDTKNRNDIMGYLAIKQELENLNMPVNNAVTFGKSVAECIKKIGKKMQVEKSGRIYQCSSFELKHSKQLSIVKEKLHQSFKALPKERKSANKIVSGEKKSSGIAQQNIFLQPTVMHPGKIRAEQQLLEEPRKKSNCVLI